jgi:hypothetical protein
VCFAGLRRLSLVQSKMCTSVEATPEYTSQPWSSAWNRYIGVARVHLQQLLNATAMSVVRALTW